MRLGIPALQVLRKETSAKADKLMEDLAKVVKKEKALKDKAFDTKFIRKDLRKAEDDKVPRCDMIHH